MIPRLRTKLAVAAAVVVSWSVALAAVPAARTPPAEPEEDAAAPAKPAAPEKAAGPPAGQKILAQKVKKADARQAAAESLAELLAELPRLPVAAVRGKPRLAPDGRGVVVDVDVRIDAKGYGAFVDKAVALLDKVGAGKEVGTFTGVAGARKLALSYDDRFPHPSGLATYPATDTLPVNLFPERVLHEMAKHARRPPGFGVWLMTSADAAMVKTRWAYYELDADFEAATKTLAGEPTVSVRLVDGSGGAIAGRERPLLRLVSQDGFRKYFVVPRAQFLTSVTARVPAEPPLPPAYRVGPPPPKPAPVLAPTLTIAPVAWWNGTLCSDVGIAYTPVVRISTRFDLPDGELSRVSKAEAGVRLTPPRDVKTWGDK